MSVSRTRPRPYVLVSPRSLAPIVLTCEHASRRLPPGHVAGGAARKLLATHWGWDICGWSLTRDLARRLGTSAIGGRWSRLWIDLNRRVDDPTLIRGNAGGTALPWNAGLSADTVERRVNETHAPYHQEVDRLILRRLVRGVRPLLFAVHTFTPLFAGRRRLFDIGLLFDEHSGPARLISRRLRAAGFSVRYNQPYSGLAGMMYAIDRHGSHHRLPCLEIEVNHALFDRPARTARLGIVVAAALRELTQI